MNFLERTQLVRQNFGLDLVLIGIEGNCEQDILERYYSFYNNKATNGEFYWLNDGKFGYFFSSEKRLFNALVRAAINFLLNHGSARFKGRKHGVIREATELAKWALLQIKEDIVLYSYRQVSEKFQEELFEPEEELAEKSQEEILETVEKLC